MKICILTIYRKQTVHNTCSQQAYMLEYSDYLVTQKIATDNRGLNIPKAATLLFYG
jgi:hypothetical protein